MMIDRSDAFVCVGFWKRALAHLLDFIIIAPVTIPFSIFVSSWAFSHRSVMLSILWGSVWVMLWMLPVVYFGGTPGKLFIGVRIVDSSGKYLSWTRALRREVFPLMLLHLFGILVLWKTVHFMPGDASYLTGIERGELMYAYGQPFAMIADVLDFAILADIGVILLNTKKRAIHDFIAGSYVITKDSYHELGEEVDNGDTSEALTTHESTALLES